MPIRMSGLASGLDTEAIIKELMTAQRTKQKKVTDKQTKLTWKQEKWKELNTKLYSFYTKELANMKKQGTFLAKKASSSNESRLTATATISAPKGSHTVTVNRLANAQSVTSGKLVRSDPSKGDVLLSTRLSELGMGVGTEIFINGADKIIKNEDGSTKLNKNEVTFEVKEETTVADFVKACGEAGLNATFDEKQQRLFISSKESGDDQRFTIETKVNGSYTGAISGIKDLIGFNRDTMTDADRAAMTDDINTLNGYSSAQLQKVFDAVKTGNTANLSSDPDFAGVSAADLSDLTGAVSRLKDRTEAEAELRSKKAAEDKIKAEIKTEYYNEKALEAIGKAGTAVSDLTEEEKKQFNQKLKELKDSLSAADVDAAVDQRYNDRLANDPAGTWKYADRIAESVSSGKEAAVGKLGASLVRANQATKDVNELNWLGLDNITGEAVTAPSGSGGMTVIKAQGAEITLDGAVLTSSSNSFTANNITFNLKDETEPGESIMVTIESDTDAVYEEIKGFVTKYNEILKEMNALYYADSSRGYDPLSDEEKDAMRDEEVERWEKKIKDSLLRRDDVLSGITSDMRSSMMRTVESNGKKYSLYSIGVRTGVDFMEKGLLHIFGDADDEQYSAEENELKKAIAEDPETVMALFNDAAKKLSEKFDKRMSRIENVRSAYTFYNDIEMKNLQRDYKKEVANWEKKLTEMEDRYYKQFAAMEKAMSQLQNQSNSLASMLGLGGN